MLRAAKITLLVCLFVSVNTTLAANLAQHITPKASLVFYSGPSNSSDLLNVYTPDGGTPPYPVVVGFSSGQGVVSDLTVMSIPQFAVGAGYAAVAVGYRTSAPDVEDDAYCALAWVYANADQYGFDTSRIALYGVSWGGMVSAFIASNDDPTPYLTNCPNALPASHPLRGVITDSGIFLTVPDEISSFVTDFGLLPNLANLPADTLQQTLDTLSNTPPDHWSTLQFADDVHDALNDLPSFHVSAKVPPFLMVQGLKDDVVPYQDTLNYASLLLGQGDTVQLVFDPPSGHMVGIVAYQDQLATFLKHIFA